MYKGSAIGRWLVPSAAAGALAFGILIGSGGTADARTFVGIGIGIPLYAPGYYAAPAYPYPYPYYDPYPPAYYAPPPAYYAPPPDYGAPPPAAYSAAPPQQECRETRVPATIGGRQEWVYGTACRQPDGSWRNVE